MRFLLGAIRYSEREMERMGSSSFFSSSFLCGGAFGETEQCSFSWRDGFEGEGVENASETVQVGCFFPAK